MSIDNPDDGWPAHWNLRDPDHPSGRFFDYRRANPEVLPVMKRICNEIVTRLGEYAMSQPGVLKNGAMLYETRGFGYMLGFRLETPGTVHYQKVWPNKERVAAWIADQSKCGGHDYLYETEEGEFPASDIDRLVSLFRWFDACTLPERNRST